MMGLSEENIRLKAELDSLKEDHGVNGSALSNGDDTDIQKLQARVYELSAHVSYTNI